MIINMFGRTMIGQKLENLIVTDKLEETKRKGE